MESSSVLDVLRFGPIRLNELTSRVSDDAVEVAKQISRLNADGVVTVADKNKETTFTPEDAKNASNFVRLTSKGLNRFLR